MKQNLHRVYGVLALVLIVAATVSTYGFFAPQWLSTLLVIFALVATGLWAASAYVGNEPAAGPDDLPFH